jgi:hypothetical protein
MLVFLFFLSLELSQIFLKKTSHNVSCIQKRASSPNNKPTNAIKKPYIGPKKYPEIKINCHMEIRKC